MYTFNCIYLNRISIFSTPAFVIGFVLQDIRRSFLSFILFKGPIAFYDTSWFGSTKNFIDIKKSM